MKRLGVILVLVIFSFSLAGCASGRKQKEMELQGLKNQVSVLENQIQSKDEEINSLKDELSKATSEKPQSTSNVSTRRRKVSDAKYHPSKKQIQVALKNAGFDPGPVNGHMSKQTKEAILAFQKANNLPTDGRVGKKTWSVLKEYLDKKVK